MRPAQIGSRNPMRKAQFSAQWWLSLHGSHYPWLPFLLWAGNVHKQLLIKCWQYMTCTVTQVFFVMNGFKLKLTTSEFVLLVMAQKFSWRTGSKTILHVMKFQGRVKHTRQQSEHLIFPGFNASTIQYTSIYCMYLSRTSTATYYTLCTFKSCLLHTLAQQPHWVPWPGVNPSARLRRDGMGKFIWSHFLLEVQF